MSKYTTQIRYICETLAGYTHSEGFDNVNAIIDEAAPKLFNFQFPIYDSNHKHALECQILLHYYTYEIGFETLGLFKLRLCSRLRDIMPYYNHLYESAALQFDPFIDVDITHNSSDRNHEEFSDSDTLTENNYSYQKGENHGGKSGYNTEAQQTPRTFSRKFSDMPQGSISDVENGSYLTEYTAESETDGTKRKDYQDKDNSSFKNDTEEHNGSHRTKSGGRDSKLEKRETTKGKTGGKSYSQLLQEYRDTILNIDLMIVDELKDLFMLLW